MSRKSAVRRRDEPIQRDSSEYLGLSTLFACGIINPFGPTLNLVGMEGEVESGRELPLLHVMLNPFQQSVTEVGSARLGEDWIPVGELEPLFSLNLGSCPTLLVPSLSYSEYQAVDLFAALLTTFEDGKKTLAGVRRFPGDPWRRVQNDVDSMMAMTRAPGSRSALTAEEGRELAFSLLEPQSQSEELKAFMTAWHGAIRFQAQSGQKSMAENAMDGGRMTVVMAMLLSSCRVAGANGR